MRELIVALNIEDICCVVARCISYKPKHHVKVASFVRYYCRFCTNTGKHLKYCFLSCFMLEAEI